MANEAWRQEYQKGRFRQTADLIEQIEDGEDADALLTLGTLYLYGMHLFDTQAEYMRFMETAPVDQQRVFWENAEESCLRGIALLERAAEKGRWAAAQNLANYFSSPSKGLTEQERASKAKYYYELELKLRSAQF